MLRAGNGKHAIASAFRSESSFVKKRPTCVNPYVVRNERRQRDGSKRAT